MDSSKEGDDNRMTSRQSAQQRCNLMNHVLINQNVIFLIK